MRVVTLRAHTAPPSRARAHRPSRTERGFTRARVSTTRHSPVVVVTTCGARHAARVSCRASSSVPETPVDPRETRDGNDGDADAAVRATPTRTFEWDRFDVFASYGVFGLTLALGESGLLQNFKYGYVPYFCALAVSSIYIGSHRGLTREFRETISFESSLVGPVVLSGALFAAYVALEVLHLDLSAFVNVYFFILGTIAVAGNATEPLGALGDWWKAPCFNVKVPDGWAVDPETREVVEDAEVDVNPAQITGTIVGIALASADMAAGHQNFTLNNAIACFIVTDFLSVIGFGSFKSCATLLSGLLAYDAFWVFKSESVVGQNVMMSVATNQSFNGPFRLLFPRFEDVLNPAPIDAFPFSLLGLGDIAVPGLLCALMLRYDAFRSTDLRARASAAAGAFMDIFETERALVESGENLASDADDIEKDGYKSGIGKRAGDAAVLAYDSAEDISEDAMSIPSSMSGRAFFSSSLSAYVAGLLCAIVANLVTGEGQPALVYLVPCTLASVIYLSSTRDELSRLTSFKDESSASSLL